MENSSSVDLSQRMNLFQQLGKKLIDQELPVEKRLQYATQIREGIEIVHTKEYAVFLEILFPAFRIMLVGTPAIPPFPPPQFVESTENSLRKIVLEILNRLPNNKVLEPHVKALLGVSMHVLEHDNEDNALVALRIIFDLHKNFRPNLGDEVEPFLVFVQQLYQSLRHTVHESFGNKNANRTVSVDPTTGQYINPNNAYPNQPMPMEVVETPASVAAAGPPSSMVEGEREAEKSKEQLGESVAKMLSRSTCSFKVLTECPLIVMLLFQLYPRFIQKNIRVLIPLMMGAMQLCAEITPPPVSIPVGTIASPKEMEKIRKRTRFCEFAACQVKTLSFLTYLLRGFADFMQAYESVISQCVVALLTCCPAEAINTRKELLVATRHILATDFRRGFFSQVNVMLRKDVLLGSSHISRRRLRPLAYSTLADLVHHMRSNLSMDQLSKVLFLFSRNIHDSSLPLTIQTTSVRLLLNLVDNIFHNKEPDTSRGRVLLVRIFTTLVNKFTTLDSFIRRLEQQLVHRDAEKMRSMRGGAVREYEQQVAASAARGVATEAADKFSYFQKRQKTIIGGKRKRVLGKKICFLPKSEKTLFFKNETFLNKKIINAIEKEDEQNLGNQHTNTPFSNTLKGSRKEAAAAKAATNAQKEEARIASSNRRAAEKMSDINPRFGDDSTSLDSMRDIKALIKTIILGLKTVVWCVSNYDRQVQGNGAKRNEIISNSTTAGGGSSLKPSGKKMRMSEMELRLVLKFCQSALVCFRVYDHPQDLNGNSGKKTKPESEKCMDRETLRLLQIAKEEKHDVLDHFAAVFTVLDPHSFRDVFNAQVGVLYNALLHDEAALAIVKHLLSNANVSRIVADILLGFLVEKIPRLALDPPTDLSEVSLDEIPSFFYSEGTTSKSVPSKEQEMETHVILQLFKLVFGSVTLFSDNELVLQPHLAEIVRKSISCAMRVREPVHFLLLIRNIFRRVAAGKFELLYKEFVPLLPGTLEALLRLQERIECHSADGQTTTEMLIELCLLIPAPLSSLLQNLSLLLRPVILALRSRTELAHLGLRTLELWINSLNPDYLYPVMSTQPLLSELMEALCDLLKASSVPHKALALKLLGKLGGRNRQFLRNPRTLHRNCGPADIKPSPSIHLAFKQASTLAASFDKENGNKRIEKSDFELPCGELVDLVMDFLSDNFKSQPNKDPDEKIKSKGALSLTQSRGVQSGRGSTSLPIRSRRTWVSNRACKPGHLPAALNPLLTKRAIADDKMEAVRFLDAIFSAVISLSDNDLKSGDSMQQLLFPNLSENESVNDSMDIDAENNEKENEESKFHAKGAEEATRALEVAEKISKRMYTTRARYGTETEDANIRSSPETVRDSEIRSIELMLQKIILAFFEASADLDVGMQAKDVLLNILKHCLLVTLSNSVSISVNNKSGSDTSDAFQQCLVNDQYQLQLPVVLHVAALEGLLDPLLMCKPLVQALCSTKSEVVKEAELMLDKIIEIMNTLFVSSLDVVEKGAAFWGAFTARLCEACHSQKWDVQLGAARCIAKLSLQLHPLWAYQHQIQLFQGLFFVMQAMLPEVAPQVMQDTQRALVILLDRCHGDLTSSSENKITATSSSSKNPQKKKKTKTTNSEKDKCKIDEETTDEDLINLLEKETASAEKQIQKVQERIVATTLWKEKSFLMKLTALFTAELCSRQPRVRKIVQYLLLRLASHLECTPLALMIKHRSRLQTAIFARQLRVHPTDVQCALLDALRFGLSLRPPVFRLTKRLSKQLYLVLRESLTLTEMRDPDNLDSSQKRRRALYGGVRFLSSSHSPGAFPFSVSLEIKLRVSVIRLLASVIEQAPNALKEAPHSELQNHCIRLFLKSLTGRSSIVTAAAHDALGSVLAASQSALGGVHTLARELLQSCLKHMLVNLKEVKHLSLALLRGLSRLLSLLKDYFDVSDQSLEDIEATNSKDENEIKKGHQHLMDQTFKLGEKLLTHLLQWTEPAKIQALHRWPGKEADVAAELVNLFHLLPPCPKFLDSLVKTVVQLDAVLHEHQTAHTMYQGYGWISSPYRKPLGKFLARYPAEATTYFLDPARLASPPYVALWRAVLSSDDASSIRAHIGSPAGIQELIGKTLALPYPAPGTLSPIESSATAEKVNTTLGSSSSCPSTASRPLLLGSESHILELHLEGLWIIYSLAKRTPRWLSNPINRILIETMLALWRSPRRQHLLLTEIGQSKLTQRHEVEMKLLVKCMLLYVDECANFSHDESGKEFVPLLFDLLTLFMFPMPFDFSFLEDFFEERVARRFSVQHRYSILHYSIQLFQEDSPILPYFIQLFTAVSATESQLATETIFASPDAKLQALRVCALRRIVTPILNETFNPTKNDDGKIRLFDKGDIKDIDVIADEKTLKLIMSEILSIDEEKIGQFSNPLRIELLQLSALLIRHIGDRLMEHRKGLIKFAWSHLKSEDSLSKHWAYINVCRFIEKYETPSKIILQVYVALLRTYQRDSLSLVQRSLDILTTALPRRLDKREMIKAMKWAKKIVYEEGHTVNQLVHIWRLITRNPMLYYPYRSQFVNQMIGSLNRLGMAPKGPIENRRLAVDLAHVIIAWEKRRRLRVVTHAQRRRTRKRNEDLMKREQKKTKLNPFGWGWSANVRELNVSKKARQQQKKLHTTHLNSSSVTFQLEENIDIESVKNENRKSNNFISDVLNIIRSRKRRNHRGKATIRAARAALRKVAAKEKPKRSKGKAKSKRSKGKAKTKSKKKTKSVSNSRRNKVPKSRSKSPTPTSKKAKEEVGNFPEAKKRRVDSCESPMLETLEEDCNRPKQSSSDLTRLRLNSIEKAVGPISKVGTPRTPRVKSVYFAPNSSNRGLSTPGSDPVEALGRVVTDASATNVPSPVISSKDLHTPRGEGGGSEKNLNSMTKKVISIADEDAASAAVLRGDSFEPSGRMVQQLVNFLVRVSLVTARSPGAADIAKRASRLLDSALKLWPFAQVVISDFEKVLPKQVSVVPGHNPLIPIKTKLMADVKAAKERQNAAKASGDTKATSLAKQAETRARNALREVDEKILQREKNFKQSWKQPPKRLLLTSLNVLNAVLRHGRNPFTQNPRVRVDCILLPCLREDDEEVQMLLHQFLVSMLARFGHTEPNISKAPPPRRVDLAATGLEQETPRNFFPQLHDVLTQVLREAAVPVPLGHRTSTEQYTLKHSFAGLAAMILMEKMSREIPQYTDAYANSLLVLVEQLAAGHLMHLKAMRHQQRDMESSRKLNTQAVSPAKKTKKKASGGQKKNAGTKKKGKINSKGSKAKSKGKGKGQSPRKSTATHRGRDGVEISPVAQKHPEICLETLKLAVQLLGQRILVLPLHRGPFFATLFAILRDSTDTSLLFIVLQLVHGWLRVPIEAEHLNYDSNLNDNENGNPNGMTAGNSTFNVRERNGLNEESPDGKKAVKNNGNGLSSTRSDSPTIDVMGTPEVKVVSSPVASVDLNSNDKDKNDRKQSVLPLSSAEKSAFMLHMRNVVKLILQCPDSSGMRPGLKRLVSTTSTKHLWNQSGKRGSMSVEARLRTVAEACSTKPAELLQHYLDIVELLLNAGDGYLSHSKSMKRGGKLAVYLRDASMLGLLSPDVNQRKRFFNEWIRTVKQQENACGKNAVATATATLDAFKVAGKLGKVGESTDMLPAMSQLGRRLDFLLNEEWGPVASLYWIPVLLESLLELVEDDNSLSVHCHSSSLVEKISAEKRSVLPSLRWSKKVDYGERGQQQLLTEHGRYLRRVSIVKTMKLLGPLCSLLYASTPLAHKVCEVLFPATWGAVSSPVRVALLPSLTSLFAQSFHEKQPRGWLNVLQSFIYGLSRAPYPKLPPAEVLLHVAQTYQSWYPVIYMLENALSRASSAGERDTFRDVLEKLYSDLALDDLVLGLRRRFCQLPDSVLALTLEGYGFPDEAQIRYYNALSQVRRGEVPTQYVDLFELRLWEEGWVRCAKKLCQWEMLNSFSCVTSDSQLQLECAVKLGDWQGVKNICGGGRNSTSLLGSSKEGWDVPLNARNFLSNILAKVHQNRDGVSRETKLFQRASYLLLKEWQNLPPIVAETHIPLLQLCHVLAECREATRIIAQISMTQHTEQVPDLKNILATWRERLPNKWESLSVWQDVLNLRSHTFATIMKNFQYEEALRARLQDEPWTVIQLSHIARRQNQYEVSLNVLGKANAD
eukprot:g1870.t1